MISYKPLLKTLIDKDKKLQDIRRDLKLSPNILAKFNKSEYVSLKTIDEICNYLDCDISDVIEHVKDNERPDQ